MTNRQIVTLVIVVLSILLTLPLMTAAQGQREGGGRGAPAPPPVNLQILPKDWTRQQVVQVMQGFNMALGVACNYCHIEMVGAPPNEKGVIPIDAAPDDKQTKKTARVMMRMVDQINDNVGDRSGKPPSEVVSMQ